MIRVFAVHARPSGCSRVAQALAGVSDVELLGHVRFAAMAERVFAVLRPDVVTMDAWLPDADGLELAASLRSINPAVGVVVVGPPTRDLVIRVVEARLSAYTSPASASVELLASVRHAAAAPTTFSASGLAPFLRRGTKQSVTAPSPRERQVLNLLGQGLGVAGIAEQLGISESTVKTYTSRLRAKVHPGSARTGGLTWQAMPSL